MVDQDLLSGAAPTVLSFVQVQVSPGVPAPIGDGASHPLSDYYASLETAQADYPAVDSLDQELAAVSIQSALDGIRPQGTLDLPPGDYILDRPLLIPNGVTLRGSGMYHGTVLRARAGATLACLARVFDLTATQNTEMVVIEGIEFNGNYSSGSYITEGLVQFQKLFNSTAIRDCYVYNYGAAGGGVAAGIDIGPGYRSEGAGGILIENCWINPNSNSVGIAIRNYYPPAVRTITGATNASPIVLTFGAAHPYVDGQQVAVRRVAGNTAANGAFYFLKTAGYDSTHAALYSEKTLTTPIAGSGSYTTGGEIAPTAFVGGIGILHTQIENCGSRPMIWTNSFFDGGVRFLRGFDLWLTQGNPSPQGVCIQLDGCHSSIFSGVYCITKCDIWDEPSIRTAILIHGNASGDEENAGNVFHSVGVAGQNVKPLADAMTGKEFAALDYVDYYAQGNHSASALGSSIDIGSAGGTAPTQFTIRTNTSQGGTDLVRVLDPDGNALASYTSALEWRRFAQSMGWLLNQRHETLGESGLLWSHHATNPALLLYMCGLAALQVNKDGTTAFQSSTGKDVLRLNDPSGSTQALFDSNFEFRRHVQASGYLAWQRWNNGSTDKNCGIYYTHDAYAPKLSLYNADLEGVRVNADGSVVLPSLGGGVGDVLTKGSGGLLETATIASIAGSGYTGSHTFVTNVTVTTAVYKDGDGVNRTFVTGVGVNTASYSFVNGRMQ